MILRVLRLLCPFYPWLNAGVSRGHRYWNKRVLCSNWWQSCLLSILVHAKFLSPYAALQILAANTARHLTQKVDLLNIQNLLAFRPVSDTDRALLVTGDTTATGMKVVGLSAHDRVLCNVVECNDTTTSSRPTGRRKMSLSGGEKRKRQT